MDIRYEHVRHMPGRKVIPVAVSFSNSWSLCIWYQGIAILLQLYEGLASLVSSCHGGQLFVRDIDAVPQPYPRGIMSTPDVTVRCKPSFLRQLVYRIKSNRTPRSRRCKFPLSGPSVSGSAIRASNTATPMLLTPFKRRGDR